MSNSNMPAMPVTAMEDVLSEDGSYCGEVEKTHPGLTKLEHFAGLAPAMPSWFEYKCVSNPSLNGGIDCMHSNKTESWITEEAKELMFMAWPVYYAKALLAQLEKGDE